MTCERVRRQLGVYRELDRAERRALAKHLSTCPDCRAAWQDEQRARALLSHVPLLEPPRALESRLLAIPATAGAPGSPFRVAPWLAVAGLTVLLFGAGVWRATGGAEAPATSGPRQPVINPVAGPATAVTRREAPAEAGQRPPLAALDVAARDVAGARDAPQRVAIAAPVNPPVRRPLTTAANPSGAAPPPAAESGTPTPANANGGHSGPNGGDDDGGGGIRPAKPPQPTASPRPTDEPLVCVDITVVAFADLAGDGTLGCPGCDGIWGDDDVAAATAAGLVLPSWQVGAYSELSGAIVDEGNLTADGGHGTFRITRCGVALPVRVQLRADAGWAACPDSGGLERSVTMAGASTVAFPVTLGCPAPTPPGDVTPTAAVPPADPLAATAVAEPTEPAPTEQPQP